MSQYHDLLAIVNMISRYVETKAGGTVNVSKYEDPKDHANDGVVFRWKKFDIKKQEMLQYNYKVSYLELKSSEDPTAIGKIIVGRIKKKDKGTDE